MDDQDKYFFKVMMGDFRRQMTIPHKFARLIRNTIQGIIELKDCNGHTFTVAVAKHSNKLVLKVGWEAFVSINDIRLGDFLVFKYDGKFQFEVLIFDPSGCVKAPSHIAGNNYHHVQQSYTDPIEISSDSDERSERPTQTPKKVPNQCKSKVNVRSSTTDLDASESADDSSSDDDQEISPVPSYILSSLAHVTQMQRMKVEKIARSLHTDTPIYGAVMVKTNITRQPCCLNFSRKYADQYLPSEDKTLWLQTNGKGWKVKFRITKRHLVGFSQGWKEFVGDNKLQIGDICLFELLKNKTRLTINVHIVRK
ncbi:hypothetical protein ACP70R_025023 [Stipagrostis hirtigluma subsp. patula]